MEEDRLYDVYALDEDIKILEEIINKPIKDTEGTKIMKQAIEHLIEAYRKVKEEKRELQNYIKEYLIPKSTINLVYIPKSKIKEKIEEYNTQREKTHKHDEYHMFVNYIDVLQELLEEE